MTDGPTESDEPERTAENKTKVERFLSRVLIDGRTDDVAEYFYSNRLLQHSPTYGDGVAALVRTLDQGRRDGSLLYQRVHRVLGEGAFCLAMSEGLAGGEPASFYDLFRLQGGKIVEHWDVVERIPPRHEWRNDNGKF